MVQSPLAFDFSKTRMICDAFDCAWAFLVGVGSDLAEPSKSLAARTILAKRIIEMADQKLTDVTELSADAVAFLRRNPPPAGPNGFGRSIGPTPLAGPDGRPLTARPPKVSSRTSTRNHLVRGLTHEAGRPNPSGLEPTAATATAAPESPVSRHRKVLQQNHTAR